MFAFLFYVHYRDARIDFLGFCERNRHHMAELSASSFQAKPFGLAQRPRRMPNAPQ
jgi:hypothetical protein